MKIATKAYGQVEIDERQIILFPVGLFGFETLHRYALLDAAQQPFYWLQSLDSEKIAFVIIKPQIFRPDYNAGISRDELQDIDLPDTNDPAALTFTIVNIPQGDQNKMSANLQGPIIINKDKRIGRQFITQDSRWGVKHNILEELARKDKG
jgi:flagellar assembly factor FliW